MCGAVKTYFRFCAIASCRRCGHQVSRCSQPTGTCDCDCGISVDSSMLGLLYMFGRYRFALPSTNTPRALERYLVAQRCSEVGLSRVHSSVCSLCSLSASGLDCLAGLKYQMNISVSLSYFCIARTRQRDLK